MPGSHRGPQAIATGFHRTHDRVVGKKRQRVVAARTDKAFEEHNLVTASAFEELHVIVFLCPNCPAVFLPGCRTAIRLNWLRLKETDRNYWGAS
jgi:hypothetical protein